MLKNVKAANMHNCGIKKPQKCIQGFTNYTMICKFKQVKKFSLKIKNNLRKPKLNTLKYDFYLILGEELLWKQNASYIITLKYYLLDFPGDREVLPMQETWVPSLVWEDSTRHGTTEPESLEPVLETRGATATRSPSSVEPEKACVWQWRPSAVINLKNKIFFQYIIYVEGGTQW